MIKRMHCPEDGTVVRVKLPSSRRLIGGGGWVISFEPAPLKVVNLFSGAEVALPVNPLRWRNQHELSDPSLKFVFSKSPTSGDCILAAMTHGPGIALCRVGRPDSTWTIQRRSNLTLEDITFATMSSTASQRTEEK